MPTSESRDKLLRPTFFALIESLCGDRRKLHARFCLPSAKRKPFVTIFAWSISTSMLALGRLDTVCVVGRTELKPVSYTHLTLPTIYSV